MKTTIRAGKTISTKHLEVVANFTNGFAENVIELSDGTLIFIGYSGADVKIVERELLETPEDIMRAVNSIPEEV